MNKKYGVAAIISGVIIVVVLVFTYGNNTNTNSIQNQQPSASNSTTINPSSNTTGRHFFAGVDENVKITTNP
ncbi:MAG TPA: hypothetical protein VNX68_14095 [Nitrosopumilaceae archaeon]|nr:hypothetical protein [Nitrosopumilaceae archaeon]